MLFCLLRDEARVPRVRFARYGVPHVADQVQSGYFRERVQKSRVRIRYEQHIAFLNLLEPANTGSIESQAILKYILSELGYRNREMLPNAGQIYKAQVNDPNAFLPSKFYYFFRFHRDRTSVNELYEFEFWPASSRRVALRERVSLQYVPVGAQKNL